MVEQLIQELQSQEAEAGLEAWQATDKSFAQCCSWVKRRADQAQACFAEPKEVKNMTATRPTKILEDQSEVWTTSWTRPDNRQFDGEALQQVLSELPRPDPLQVDLHITAEGLRKAMHKMLRKAGGADGWEATDLVRLPEPFWAAAARLWNRVLETGHLPASWTRALVVLIPKPDGRTRPIGLMSLLWRAGARILVKQLRAWSHTWTTAAAMGGLAGVGVADAHLRLLGAYNRGTRSYFKQDLSHFFDSLSLDVLIPLLEHYRAPSTLVQLIKALYSDSRRLFKVQGFTAQDFTRVNTGVIQGCPLSPLLSLLVGQAWATYAVGQSSGITAMVYIDDRGLWPKARHPNAVDEMRTALRRSDFFDRALELQCKPEKCALAHSPQDPSMVALAEERHYERRSVLEFLGIRFDLFSQECTPLKLNLGNLRWRLRFIKRLGAPLSMLTLLISALVGAALVWAGGVAKPEDKELRAIADELYHMLQSNFLRDTPRLLLHELLGWRTEPHFACDLAALRAVGRYLSNTPAWKDHVPIAEAFDSWMAVLPQAAQVIDRFGWQVLKGGKQLSRCDDLARQRFFNFGYDSPQVLEEWLSVEYRRMFLNRCGRVRQRLHRDGQFASGMDLPAPVMQDLCFAGHRQLFHQAPSLSVRRAAAGTGGSFWYWAAGSKIGPEDERSMCLCKAREPSRAHLTWTCPATAHLRGGLEVPTDRCEERLLAKPLPQWPPAPVCLDEQGFVEQLAEDALQAAAEADALYDEDLDFQDFAGDFKDRWMIAATDGSARDGVAAYSVVFPGGRGGGSGDASEDQSPFRAELKALLILFQAMLRAQDQGIEPRVLWVVVDCQSALDALTTPGASCLPLLAAEAAAGLRALKLSGWQVHTFWCPSHGKKPEWTAPGPLQHHLCRLLNEEADAQARRAMERRRAGSLRVRWKQLAAEAEEWEKRAIYASAKASDIYGAHFIELRRRSRETIRGSADDSHD